MFRRYNEGLGFPLTRKNRGTGFTEIFIASAILSLLLVFSGFDSVEFGRFLEFLKGLNAITLS